MKRLKLANWAIDVDVETTRHYNQEELEVCGCLHCENFSLMILQKHRELRLALMELGIDAARPNHVSYFLREEDGQYLAIGNYHFCGTLVKGEWCTMEDWNETNTAEVDGMQLGLSKEMELLPDNFPAPAVQVNFEIIMPWLLGGDPEK